MLLVHPPYVTGFTGQREKIPQYHPPMGLAYIASCLEKGDVEVKILDCDPMQLDPDGAAKQASSGYDVVGITALTATISTAVYIARRVKELSPSTTTVLGGAHPTVLPEEPLKVPEVDIVVRGEGEVTMLELVRCIEGGENLKNVKGISFRQGGEIIHAPSRPLIRNLDELPFPARHLLPNEKYWTIGVMRTPWASILTSRGCPEKCVFCSRAQGGWWRFRSAQNVLAEIRHLVEKYKIREFDVIDDNFLLWRKRAEEIFDGIIEEGWDLIWRCGNGVRVDTVDRDLLVKMYRSGCRYLAFGVESGSQEILNRTKKNITLNQVTTVFKWCREIGIKTTAFFMIGNLGENEKTIRQTIKFAKELDPDNAQFSLATPYPGTEMYEIIRSQGRLITTDWSKWTHFTAPLFEFEELNPELMKKMYREAHREFTLRPKYIARRLLQVRTLTELRGLISGGLWILSLVRDKK